MGKAYPPSRVLRPSAADLVGQSLELVCGELVALHDYCADVGLEVDGFDAAVFAASRAVAEALQLLEVRRVRSVLRG